MPGGRLTHDDRRRIAAALAQGRTYAEIARDLDRPKSTISREVSRNGGPAAYRADRAHRDTLRRARRGRTAPPPPAPPLPAAEQAYGRDPEAVRAFAERFTEACVNTGMPRMAARVLTCLYTTDAGALTAAELVALLRVSPASVSTSIALLEGLGLVRREVGPRRRERYSVDDDVWFQAMIASVRQNQELADIAGEGADVLGVATPAGARLRGIGHFLGLANRDFIRTIERWRDMLAEGKEPW